MPHYRWWRVLIVALWLGSLALGGWLCWWHGFYTGADAMLCAVEVGGGEDHATAESCVRLEKGVSWRTR